MSKIKKGYFVCSGNMNVINYNNEYNPCILSSKKAALKYIMEEDGNIEALYTLYEVIYKPVSKFKVTLEVKEQ